MKELVTAAEIGEILRQRAFPIRRRAARENWPYIEREGNGGLTRLYDPALLPEEIAIPVQVALLNRLATRLNLDEFAPKPKARPTHVGKPANLTPEQRARADARVSILKACDAFVKASDVPKKHAAAVFCDLYGTGGLTIDAGVRALVKPFSFGTLRNWQRLYKREGLVALAGAKYGKHRIGAGQIDRDVELREFIHGMLVQHSHASGALVMHGLRARFSKNRVPSYEKVCRWIRAWKRENAQIHMAVTNPDAWRSNYRAAGGDASATVKTLNQRWELDSSPFDVACSDGRHALIGVIDVYSRRKMFHVVKTSTAAGIAHLMRRAILAWGVPQSIKTDNGADYTAQHIRLLCADLAIDQELCTKHSPWEKPHIERAFRTFQHGLVELLPGFIGHSVADAQAIRSRMSFADRLSGKTIEVPMTPEELQSFCDRWCESVDAHNPHEGLDGKTPFQMLSEFRLPIAKIENERALDILLMPAAKGEGYRTVGKKGIKAEGATYDHPELGGLEGKRVFVRMDLEDVGRIYVFDEDRNFICVAVDPEIVGVSRKEIATHRRAKQAKIISEARSKSKALGRKVKDIAVEIIAYAESKSAPITLFPKATTTHESEGLAKAADAAAAIDSGEAAKPPLRQRIEPAPAPVEVSEERLAQLGFKDGSVEFLKPKLKTLGF